MDVRIASPCGFCFGVRRALELTTKALKTHDHVFALGNLIHNENVIRDLKSRGLVTVSSLDKVRSGPVVIRAHGVPRHVYDEANERDITLIDATCPFVKRAQQAARQLSQDGYSVLLVGDENHAEVIGIVSAADGDVLVVNDTTDVLTRDLGSRVGVLFQTTQLPETANEFATVLTSRVRDLRIINTICRATAERQAAVRYLAPSVDIMIVVGDPNSANTTRLAAIAESLNPRTLRIDDASQIGYGDVAHAQTVGLTAGASTPDEIIREVQEKLSRL